MGIRNQLYKKMVSGADRRSIPWELDFTQWESLVGEDCHYCGVGPSNRFKYGKGEYVYSGLDRLDSGLSYSIDNVVPCCRFCNVLKSSLRPETWFDFLNGVIRLHGGEVPEKWANYIDLDRARKAPNQWKR